MSAKGNGSKPEYRTEPASRGSIQQSVTATGTVNAVTTVLVGTQVSGTIRTLYVDFNSHVTKGQVIAQIDPSTFESQVQQAQANLLLAQANLEKATTAVVDTKRTFERNRELFSKNLIPRSDLDTSETNYDSARAQVSASKAQVEQAKAALDYRKTESRLYEDYFPGGRHRDLHGALTSVRRWQPVSRHLRSSPSPRT